MLFLYYKTACQKYPIHRPEWQRESTIEISMEIRDDDYIGSVKDMNEIKINLIIEN